MKKLLIFLLILTCGSAFGQTRPNVTQIQTVENIAELKTMAPATDKTWAFVGGYYSHGDGGGGNFYWDSSSSAADNTGTIISSGVTPGRWIRYVEPYADMRVEWFGAMPDSGKDEATRIQAAIDAAGGKHVVRFPVGVFLIGATLNNTSTLTTSYPSLYLMGATNRANTNAPGQTTVLRALDTMPGTSGLNVGVDSGVTGQIILNLTPGATVEKPPTGRVDIKGIGFRGNIGGSTPPEFSSIGDEGVIGVYSKDFRLSRIVGCNFSNMHTGIAIDGQGYYSSIEDNGFSRIKYGLAVRGNWNQSKLVGNRISLAKIGMVFYYGGSGIVVDKSYIEQTHVAGIYSAFAWSLSVKNSYFEWNQGLCVSYGSSGGTGRFLFDNNHVTMNASASALFSITSVEMSGETASAPATMALISNNLFKANNASYTFNLFQTTGGSAYVPKLVTLVSNTYSYPNIFNKLLIGSSTAGNRVNRIGDGYSNIWQIGRDWSSTLPPGTEVVDEAREPFYRGMLRFNYSTSKFQGVASTTVGWEDLH